MREAKCQWQRLTSEERPPGVKICVEDHIAGRSVKIRFGVVVSVRTPFWEWILGTQGMTHVWTSSDDTIAGMLHNKEPVDVVLFEDSHLPSWGHPLWSAPGIKVVVGMPEDQPTRLGVVLEVVSPARVGRHY